jgi:hypothetical protein
VSTRCTAAYVTIGRDATVHAFEDCNDKYPGPLYIELTDRGCCGSQEMRFAIPRRQALSLAKALGEWAQQQMPSPKTGKAVRLTEAKRG